MLCSFDKQIFPKDNQESPNGFYIVRYICNEHSADCELAVDEKGNDLCGEVFFAKGTNLTRSRSIRYNIHGRWEKNKKQEGRTFVVESFEENISKDKVSIIEFLSSCIKGIGPKTALTIYNHFGEETLDIIDNEPMRLLEIESIKSKKLEKIITSYTSFRSSRNVVMTLMPMGISQNLAMNIYEKFKDEAIDIIQNHPFKLCRFKGISFYLADGISQKNGLNPHSLERIEAALIDILYQAENGGDQFRTTTGHLCVEYNEWLFKAYNLLNREISREEIVNGAMELKRKNKIVTCWSLNPDKLYIYREYVNRVEHELAESIISILKSPSQEKINYDEEIRLMELKEKVSLAPEQNNAVKLGLSHQFAVITGGPGTGKTTIIKFIRNIYLKNNKDKKILMCSPTGVAATRMSESTDGEACTAHKALNLAANEDGIYDVVEELDYDLIIVDETSMLDIYLARILCKAVKKGAKLLFIGDVEQLPSVGPGAVLRDIIESNVVPVSILTKVYRQEDGSLIALNALLIKNGKCSFDYGDSFQFIPTNNFDEAAAIMKDIYIKEIAVNGIQNVMMLSPFRQKTETGVNSLNKMRDMVNAPSSSKKEILYCDRIYREGDKVIQLKNIDNISNGDVGYISKISTISELKKTKPFEKIDSEADIIEKDDKTAIIVIDFGNGRVVEYELSDLEMIDWSYAMTVHKSQGSEANTVIFNLLDAHGIMLKRNLLYTAITRAKKKVIIIGQFSAIEKAVASGLSLEDRRNSLLSQRLKYLYEREAI